MTRLVSFYDVDFVLAYVLGESAMVCQEIASIHKKILMVFPGATDDFTQRVLDDYEDYKYSFNTVFNTTSTFIGMTDNLLVLREDTGFNKVGYLGEDLAITQAVADGLEAFLPNNGFELVYKGKFPLSTVDFSSYFSAAEEAGVEILLPLIGLDGGIPFIKEYYDRQSPMVVYGGVLHRAADLEAWESTDGKCEYISVASLAINAKYPLTSKTLQTYNAYIDRWGETPPGSSIAFDSLRYILADAIRRVGTIETEAVIKALEETSIETTSAKNFVFTESHAVMMGENPNDPNADYMLALLFQWQNGELVPVYPKKIMEEAGASYMFPDWPGPWDKIS
jgi:branched-chain amino acid transport system substrate-binding protein